MTVFRINMPDEESIDFFVDNEYVGDCNYAEHGRAAMADMKALFEKIAVKVGAIIVCTEA